MFKHKFLLPFVLSLLLSTLSLPFSTVYGENSEFKKVTAKLDSEGDFYLYLNTDQTRSIIKQKLEFLKILLESSCASMPEDKRKNMTSGIELVLNMLKGSGLSEIKAVGMSSVPNEKEKFYRSKAVFYHPQNTEKGIIWKAFGKTPHKLDSLKLLPTDTVCASFTDFDSSALWNWIKDEINKSNMPSAKEGIAKFEKNLKEKEGIDLSKLLASIDNRLGVIFTLDKNKKAIIPLKTPIEIPEPSLALVIYVKDTYLFDILKKKIPCAPKNPDTGEIQKFQIMFGLPIPVRFQPMLAKTGNIIILASNEEIINNIISARKNLNGFITTEEFKRLSASIPDTGSGYKFISPELSRLAADIQSKILSPSSPARTQAFNKIIESPYGDLSLFSVYQNTEEGFDVTINSNVHLGNMLIIQGAVAPTAVMAGMLLPALNSAREKARRISCASNLKQIGLALKMYSMDHKDKFPVKDGAAGLEELRAQDYLTDPKMYICPSSSGRQDAAGKPLSENNVSYFYLGGFTETDPADVPLAFDKSKNHSKYVNILFLDGHVQGITLGDTSPEAVIEYLNSQYNYPPDIYQKLKEKVKQFSTQK